MSQFFIDKSVVPGGEVLTTSAQGGAHFPPDNTGNVDFSGAANGAITFAQVANGAVTASVNVDGTTIIVNGSNQLESINGAMIWTVVTTNTTAVRGHGYMCNSFTPITFTLPVSAAIGDTISIVDILGGTWIINGGGLATLQFGLASATQLTSEFVGDALTLICKSITPITWFCWPVTGNIQFT